LLFWPIVIVLGAGFVALYYDHDVKPFTEPNMGKTDDAKHAFG
jgi:hypothetical protein